MHMWKNRREREGIYVSGKPIGYSIWLHLVISWAPVHKWDPTYVCMFLLPNFSQAYQWFERSLH